MTDEEFVLVAKEPFIEYVRERFSPTQKELERYWKNEGYEKWLKDIGIDIGRED